MIGFKQYLDEGRRASARVKQLLSSRAKPYEYWLSKKFTLPFCISKPMMTRMQNTQTDVNAFHVTDIDFIKTLFEVQNSSKSLSVTTEIEKEKSQIMEELKQEFSTLVTHATSRVIGETIDNKHQQTIIDNILNDELLSKEK